MTHRDVVVAGGGTAGHVLPALEVARALVDRGHAPGAVALVGSRRGPDQSLLAGTGFPVTLVSGRGIARQLSARSLARNGAALLGVAGEAIKMVRAFSCWRPSAAVSLGGYAAVPVGVAAVVHRVPLVLVTVDAVPGLTQRLLGRFARASAVAFAGTALPRAVVTGTPVRAALGAVERTPEARARAAAALGLPAGRTVVAAVGGSLGSRRINQAVAGLAERWAGRADLCLYHVTGRRDWEELGPLPASPPSGGPGPASPAGLAYVRVPFEERMDRLYGAADILVGRAGGMTVAEVALCGVPSVLVPLPGAPGDHQSANAAALVEAGAALVVADQDCDTAHLGALVETLVDDPDRRSRMEAAAKALGHPDAAAKVAELVDRHAR